MCPLNFKGTEYAFARKFLLRNLSGNSGWRTEEAKARHDARKVRAEIEAPEVTIGQSSEGGEADAGNFPINRRLETTKNIFQSGTRVELVSMSDPFYEANAWRTKNRTVH